MSKEGQGSRPPPETPCSVCTGEKIFQDFHVLVQKVGGRPEVLLIGETLEGRDIQALMGSFVKDLFSSTCHPVHPGDLLKEPSSALCALGGKPCKLIFFLCRASCMKSRQAELRKVLKEVKRFVQKSPCALVGVIMEPKKGEEAEARGQLESLLHSVFPKPQICKRGKQAVSKADPAQTAEVEVEVEIYVPGQPHGKMAVMRAACRASEALAKPAGARGCQIYPMKRQGGLENSRGSQPLSSWWNSLSQDLMMATSRNGFKG